jgi:hypothetical protein
MTFPVTLYDSGWRSWGGVIIAIEPLRWNGITCIWRGRKKGELYR